MWADGLVDEVRHLETVGLRRGRTASRAIGYAQALGQLDGELSRAEAIASTQAATRRYARRQESWLRPDPRVRWLDAAAPDLVDQAAELVSATIAP
jgi:tRNA dimethylallyltransferase